jgi:nucleotide-binding universal stress UspA family protein
VTARRAAGGVLRARRILVPVDLSPSGDAALRAAAGLAKAAHGRLLLLHVFDRRALEDVYKLHGLTEAQARERMKANADAALAKLRRRPWLAGVAVQARYATGLPAPEIVAAAAAWKADLVVLARRRRAGLANLLYGASSDGVVREAPCAVLVIPE